MAYKEDLRIIRTRKLLFNTLLDIMEDTSIEKISVIDLCNKAMVNRATFYAHFEDKYHLLNFALEELKDEVYNNFNSDLEYSTPNETLSAIMIMVAEFIFNQHGHIAKIIANNRNEKVLFTIIKSLASSIKYQLAKFKDKLDFQIPLSIVSDFFAGGLVNVALYCIDNPDKFTFKDVINYIHIATDSFIFSNKIEPAKQ